MEETDLLKMAGVSTSGLAIILIVYRLLKTISGKKLVSSCCGRKLEVGIAVAPMTPTPDAVVVTVPTPNDTIAVNNPMKALELNTAVEIKK